MCCRIGEAANPGPTQSNFALGVFNPSGLKGKSPYIVSHLSFGDLWAVSETHLCHQSLAQFRSSSHFAKSPFRYSVGGYPVPAQQNRMYHNAWRGVAVLSKYPTRPVPSELPSELFQSSRVVITTSLVHDMWVTGGTVYGEPDSSSYPFQKTNNEALLHHVANHVCHLSRGPRYVAGDWNVAPDSLPVFAQLEAAGFRDLQDIALSQWGVPVQHTCKQATRKDFCFVSPELQQLLLAVHVDQDIFPDHAVLWGEFRPLSSAAPRQIWPLPQPFPWPNQWPVDADFWNTAQGSCEDKYQALWQHIETRAAAALPFPVSSRMLGRASTRSTIQIHDGKISPPKAARKGDIQPQFVGATFRHAQWLRQTRRLQTYLRYVKAHSCDTLHVKRVWGSILRATGFHPGFSIWWTTNTVRTFGAPAVIPLLPPAGPVVVAIFDTMQLALRAFETDLRNSSRLYTRLKRDTNPNAIFHDLREFTPRGVEVLLRQVPAQIVEVRLDDQSVVLNRPVQFVPDVPIVSHGAALPVVYAEHDCIWLEDVSGLSPGCPVTQLSQIGTHDDLSREFLTTWKGMWERHRDVPLDRWRTILDFARQHLPRKQMDWPGLDVEALRACLTYKKPTTAGGLDGVTLSDLKAMPDGALHNFTQLFAQAEVTGAWPSQVVAGRVSCLAKTPVPEKVLDFRPITVLGLLYRCWGTYHARHVIRALEDILPIGLYGSRPRRYAGQLWSHVLWAIEHAYASSIPLCGIIVDIQKAFNFLPRLVVFESCALIGLPFGLLKGWAGALTCMERRFQLCGSLTEPALSDCGLPEGCALSCVGMMVVDMLFHAWMTNFFPLCQPLSYVDDWQVLLTSPDLIGNTFHCIEQFTHAIDLLLDQRKTHTWSVSGVGRQSLRDQGLDVVHYGHNLGAHVQFSRQHTNSVLMERVNGITSLWPRLRLSACGYAQKIRAIKAAAWPRCLHGVAAATLSFATFKALRSGAMKGIRADSAGANPMVHLGLIEAVDVDPLGWAILQTLRLTRDCGSQENVEQVLAEIVSGVSAVPNNSITHTLCTRIQLLGWHIDAQGSIHDLLGSFSLFGVSVAEIHYRMSLQWPYVVAAHTAHRRCFSGLEQIDPSDTKLWLQSLDVADQALFRKLLNGSHVTQNGKAYCQEVESDVCPYCHCSDSRYYRFWECAQFASFRSHLCADTLRCICDLPEALTESGWSLQPTTALEWNQYFAAIEEPNVPSFEFSGDVHLFTDGSCYAQQDVHLRFAGWAVVQASFAGVHDYTGSRILDSGVLPGLLQSSVRAEIYAVLHALRLTVHHAGSVYIWTDCDAVVRRLCRILAGAHVRTNSAHADLWSSISQCLVGRTRRVFITRVAAHRCPEDASTALAEWCFRNNGLADKQAGRANVQRTAAFWALQRRHSLAVAGIAFLNRTVQAVLLQISQEVVRQETPCLVELPALPVEPALPLQPWTGLPRLTIPAAATRWYGDAIVRTLASWFWYAVTDSLSPIAWVSHFQLYADFMLSMGHPGPVHIDRWRDGSVLPWVSLAGYAYKQRTRWFTKVLKEILRHQGVKLQMGYGKPCSQMLLFHTGVIAVPWPRYRLSLVDDWFLRCSDGNTFRRQSKVLDRMPIAALHPEFPLVPISSLGL